MWGSNYYGQPEFGISAAEAEALQLKAVSASVTTTASITTLSIVNKIVSATVVATGSIAKQFQRTLNVATTTVHGALGLTRTIKALNVIRGITKFLDPRRTTRNLTPDTTTEPLAGLRRNTRRLREE